MNQSPLPASRTPAAVNTIQSDPQRAEQFSITTVHLTHHGRKTYITMTSRHHPRCNHYRSAADLQRPLCGNLHREATGSGRYRGYLASPATCGGLPRSRFGCVFDLRPPRILSAEEPAFLSPTSTASQEPTLYLGMSSGRAGPAKRPTQKTAAQAQPSPARPDCRVTFSCPGRARRAGPSLNQLNLLPRPGPTCQSGQISLIRPSPLGQNKRSDRAIFGSGRVGPMSLLFCTGEPPSSSPALNGRRQCHHERRTSPTPFCSGRAAATAAAAAARERRRGGLVWR
jgi:hypothetical protein